MQWLSLQAEQARQKQAAMASSPAAIANQKAQDNLKDKLKAQTQVADGPEVGSVPPLQQL